MLIHFIIPIGHKIKFSVKFVNKHQIKTLYFVQRFFMQKLLNKKPRLALNTLGKPIKRNSRTELFFETIKKESLVDHIFSG